MDLLAPVTRHLIAPAWARWERSPYLRHYRRLLRTQYDPPAVVRQRQWQRVRGLLEHACRSTPFWRERFQSAGLQAGDLQGLEDLRALPLLTKADLREGFDAMLSDEYRGASLHLKKTSGSTGVSVQVLVDDEAQQFKRACTLRADEWSGWRRGQRVAAIWGNPEYLKHGWRGRLRNVLLERTTFLDTLSMDEAAVAAFVAVLRRWPAALLMGHAHSLYLVADYFRACGVDTIRPRAIISTAMVLHQWERRTIEETLLCPVTDRYGCEEVSLIACQCKEHEGLHINADGIYLEILRPDGTAAEPGEAGMVVVTDLVNRAMPILRYQVGDMAILSDRPCACGRGLPLLERIEGRVADYVVTPRGQWISGISLTENFAVLVPGVAQLQIVQEEVDRFTFRIVRGRDFGPGSLAALRGLVAERFGPGIRYECQYLDRIPQEASGKYRFCISRVPKGLPATMGK